MNRRFLNMTPSNEGTLNITIVDNTPTGASTSAGVLQFIGKPNDPFTSFNRTVSRASNYILTSPTAVKTGDIGSNVSIGISTSGATGFQNGNIAVSGTIPSGEVNVTITIDCTISEKLDRNLSASGSFPGTNGGGYSCSTSGSGGGVASGYTGATVDEYGALTVTWITQSVNLGGQLSGANSSGNGSLTSMYVGFSCPETATYKSGSATAYRTY